MAEQEVMQEWMKIAQPGKEHQLLAEHAGKWIMTMRASMAPEEHPAEGKGTSSIRSLLSGRIIAEEIHGQFGDMPFEGFGSMGFDNFRKKFWQTWSDWMTGLYYAEGTVSADGKTLTFAGKMDRPEQNRKNVDTRTVYRFLDKDHFIFEMYTREPDGKELKGLEIDYRRK